MVGEAHRRAAAAARQGETDGQRVAAAPPGRPGDAVANGLVDVAGVKRVVADRDAGRAGDRRRPELVAGGAEPVAPRRDAAGDAAGDQHGAGPQAGADHEACGA